MALCNLTQKILSNQCIGDSLRTINSNFSALDIGICSIPDIIEGEGFDIDLQLNPLGTRTYLELSPTRFPVFKKDFDTTQNITLTSIFLTNSQLFLDTNSCVLVYFHILKKNLKIINRLQTISSILYSFYALAEYRL